MLYPDEFVSKLPPLPSDGLPYPMVSALCLDVRLLALRKRLEAWYADAPQALRDVVYPKLTNAKLGRGVFDAIFELFFWGFFSARFGKEKVRYEPELPSGRPDFLILDGAGNKAFFCEIQTIQKAKHEWDVDKAVRQVEEAALRGCNGEPLAIDIHFSGDPPRIGSHKRVRQEVERHLRTRPTEALRIEENDEENHSEYSLLFRNITSGAPRLGARTGPGQRANPLERLRERMLDKKLHGESGIPMFLAVCEIERDCHDAASYTEEALYGTRVCVSDLDGSETHYRKCDGLFNPRGDKKVEGTAHSDLAGVFLCRFMLDNEQHSQFYLSLYENADASCPMDSSVFGDIPHCTLDQSDSSRIRVVWHGERGRPVQFEGCGARLRVAVAPGAPT